MSDAHPLPDRIADARPDDDPIERQRLRASVVQKLLGEPAEPPRLGRYLVLQALGSGAMGVVYAAYDTQLDRKVAIKLIEPELRSGVEAQERLAREAQVLAKLSHPNIVAVHDVGSVDDHMWIAMELVDGRTLGEWLREHPRRWTEVLPVILDVGRGLAAAHAAGIVHRDCKPDNIMIDRTGRVRLMDFGLARPEATRNDAPSAGRLNDTLSEESNTSTGLAGTPGFVAPEVLDGARPDARADQFAFCVTAWQALFGARPTTSDGRHRPEVARRPPGVPAWLTDAIARGLDPDPHKRWPRIDDLVDALASGRQRSRSRRRLLAAGALLGVGALVVAGWHFDREHRIAACEREGAAIEEDWNPSRRDELRRGLLATGVGHAESTADKVTAAIDAHADAWRDATTGACLAHDLESRWDGDLLDRSRWCLDDRRTALRTLVDRLVEPDAEAAHRAVVATSRLDAIDPCEDELQLRHAPAPPPAADRDAIAAIRIELARAVALERGGRYTEALAVVQALRERAQMAGWPPLVVDVQLREAHLLGEAGDHEGARATAEAAYFDAARMGAWATAAALAIDLASTTGRQLAKPEEGMRWIEHAATALVHAGDTDGLAETERLNALGNLHAELGQYALAKDVLQGAYEKAEGLLGPDHPDVAGVLANLAGAHAELGEVDAAIRLGEDAARRFENAFGPNHPDLAKVFNNLARNYWQSGNFEHARTLMVRALELLTSRHGPRHPLVAQAMASLANVLVKLGEHERARELYEQTLAIVEETLGAEHPLFSSTLNNLAALHADQGEYAKAGELLRRAIELKESTRGPDHPEVATSLMNLAEVELADDDGDEAARLTERALAIQERAFAPDHPAIAITLSNLGAVRLATDDLAGALAAQERALAIREGAATPDPLGIATTLAGLAETHRRLGHRDRARELALRSLAIFDEIQSASPGAADRERKAVEGVLRDLAADAKRPTR